jgi:hypothetical protein
MLARAFASKREKASGQAHLAFAAHKINLTRDSSDAGAPMMDTSPKVCQTFKRGRRKISNQKAMHSVAGCTIIAKGERLPGWTKKAMAFLMDLC